ncbi:MAG: type II toxin-antitoxin system VapC family toxin [Gemmataceae bacterium]|nr:type II toxin-antitoxin system VapC family toxin [Gemmataceae bacterium]
MKYVLDSNVAFKWGVPEPDSDKANRLRDAFRNSLHEFLAPDFFPIELGHALTRAERQNRILADKLVKKLQAHYPFVRLLSSVP